jgi:ArsR family transcriptional regulator
MTRVAVAMRRRAALSTAQRQEAASLLKALADPARLQVIEILKDHPDGEACACDLIEPLGLRQPTVSHHLKVLTDVGLLEREKRGTWAWYRLVPSRLESVADLLRS